MRRYQRRPVSVDTRVTLTNPPDAPLRYAGKEDSLVKELEEKYAAKVEFKPPQVGPDLRSALLAFYSVQAPEKLASIEGIIKE